jgi:hypothetical protein
VFELELELELLLLLIATLLPEIREATDASFFKEAKLSLGEEAEEFIV